MKLLSEAFLAVASFDDVQSFDNWILPQVAVTYRCEESQESHGT